MADGLIKTSIKPGFEKPIDEKTLILNKEYDNNTGEGFNEWKINGGGLPFGKFEPETTIKVSDDISGNLESQENQRKIDENPNTPLVDGLVNQGLLTFDEGKLVKEVLIKSGDIEKNILEIEEIDPKIKKQIIDTINFLNGVEAKTQSIKKFNKDFGIEIDGLKQNVEGGKKGEKELSGKNKELIDILGGNYFNLDGGQEDNKDALDRSFKTTLNQLMDGKSFERPETFDIMLETVKNPELSFKERFDKLKEIDKLINTFEGEKGKQGYDYRKMKKGVEKKAGTLEEKFNNFKRAVAVSKENKNYKELENLLEEGIALKEEKDDSGEVFEGGDIDKLLSDTKEILKEQA